MTSLLADKATPLVTQPASTPGLHEPGLFSELYESCSGSVFNLVLRSVHDWETAQDVSQEVWIKVHHNIHTLRSREAAISWVFTIASRACISAARRKAVRPLTAELDEDTPSAAPNPELAFLGNDDVRLVWEALGSLKPRQQLALYLREVEGRGYAEIADMLGTSESAVETLLFRARRSLGRVHGQLNGSSGERCRQAGKVMAALIDGQATPIQEHGLKAHAEACMPCNRNLRQMRAGSAAYAGLPLTQAPNLLAALSGGAGVMAVSSLGSGSLAGLVAALAQAKIGLMVLLAGAILGSAGLAADVGMPSSGSPAAENSSSTNPAPITAPLTQPATVSAFGQNEASVIETSSGPLEVHANAATASEDEIAGSISPPTSKPAGLAAASIQATIGTDGIDTGVHAGLAANGAASAAVNATVAVDPQNLGATASASVAVVAPLVETGVSVDIPAAAGGQPANVVAGVQPAIPPLPLPPLLPLLP